MSKPSRQRVIWTRAVLRQAGAGAREGDAALASVLQLHGLFETGGFGHVAEAMSSCGIHQAAAGFRYFGFSETASLLERAATANAADAAARHEAAAAAIPIREAVLHAFRLRLLAHPRAFAPVVEDAQA